jgi:hypothetical protein
MPYSLIDTNFSEDILRRVNSEHQVKLLNMCEFRWTTVCACLSDVAFLNSRVTLAPGCHPNTLQFRGSNIYKCYGLLGPPNNLPWNLDWRLVRAIKQSLKRRIFAVYRRGWSPESVIDAVLLLLCIRKKYLSVQRYNIHTENWLKSWHEGQLLCKFRTLM